MQKCCSLKKGWFAVHLMVAMVVVIGMGEIPGRADTRTDPLRIHQTESQAIAIHQKTQQAEDRWADEKVALRSRYRTLTTEEKTLARRHATLKAQVAALESRKAEAERTIAETERVAEGLQTHLDMQVIRLEEQVARDLPFLPAEREARLVDLKKILIQPDTSLAERSRRVMEALKIEAEYGQTVEVYQETLNVADPGEGQTIMADILRVGRLALFWRTPDGKAVGKWDRVEGQWARLPKKYRRAVNDAMEMALRRRSIDMVKLPLGRIAQR